MSEPRPSVRRPAPPPPPIPAVSSAAKTSRDARGQTSGRANPFEARDLLHAPPPPTPAATFASPFKPRMRNGAGAGLSEIEPAPELRELDTAHRAIEVSVLWGDTSVLHLEHLSPPRPYYVGEAVDGEAVDFVISEEALGARRLPLCIEMPSGVEIDDRASSATGGKRFAAVIPPNAAVTLRHEGRVLRRAELERDGELAPYAKLAGARTLVLPEGAMIRVEQGAFVFVVRSVAQAKKVGADFAGFDMRALAYLGGSMAFFGLMLALFAFAPPQPAALSLDHLDQESRLVKFVVKASELSPPEPTPAGAAASGGPEGASAPDESGKAGDPKESRDGKLAQQGSAEHTVPKVGPERSAEEIIAQTVIGTLAALQWQQPSAVFRSDNAIGADPMNVIGNLLGDAIGPGQGNGGVGMIGTGIGGDNGVEGAIGIGRYGTQSGKGGPGDDGYGSCKGSRCGQLMRDGGGVPTIRINQGQVQGSLSREAIRRVVRQHLPEVKACYEQGLVGQPDLEGRVAVRFIISPSGAVQSALVQDTSLHHGKVESCVTGAVQRWGFPTPENGGIVVVSYPFQFTRTE